MVRGYILTSCVVNETVAEAQEPHSMAEKTKKKKAALTNIELFNYFCQTNKNVKFTL